MPKKKTAGETAPDTAEMLQEPAFAAPEGETAVPVINTLPPAPVTAWPWPESVERRALLVPFTDHDRSELARKFATVQEQKEDIEDEAKLAAKAAKQRIDALESEISHIAAKIKADGDNRDVECRWVFEVSGIDETGNWIPNPGYKVLVRQDTLEIVCSKAITDEERQMSMPLADGGMTDEECERFVSEAGFALQCDEQPAEGFSPFYLVSADGNGEHIEVAGDSRAGALRSAVAKLRDMLAEKAAEIPDGPAAPDDGASPDYTAEGIEARTLNMPRSRCPYPAGSNEAQEWKMGWDKKDAEIEADAAAGADDDDA